MNYRVVKRYQNHIESPETTAGPLGPGDSILLIRLSAIGDAIRTLPVVQYLRSNGFTGTLGCAVQPPIDDILSLWDDIDHVHTVRRDHLPYHPIRYVRHLGPIRERNYDWVVDLHGLIKSALVGFFSGGDHRIGFDKTNGKEFNHLFQHTTAGPQPEGLPRILKYTQVVRSLTPDYDFARENLVPPEPSFPAMGKKIRNLAEESPVLVQTRTSNSRYGQRKEWGVPNSRRLLERLLDRTDTAPIALTWGPGERETAEKIASSFDERVRPTPETDLVELTYLVNKARLMISPDTATAHLADLLGTPLVALYGASDYYINGPLLTDYRLITPRENERTTEDIPVKRVLPACLDLLEKSPQ